MLEDVSKIRGKERRLLSRSLANELEQIIFERGEYEKDDLCKGLSRKEVKEGLYVAIYSQTMVMGSIYEYLEGVLKDNSIDEKTRNKINKMLEDLKSLKSDFTNVRDKEDEVGNRVVIDDTDGKNHKKTKFEEKVEEWAKEREEEWRKRQQSCDKEDEEDSKESPDSEENPKTDEKPKKKRDRDYDR